MEEICPCWTSTVLGACLTLLHSKKILVFLFFSFFLFIYLLFLLFFIIIIFLIILPRHFSETLKTYSGHIGICYSMMKECNFIRIKPIIFFYMKTIKDLGYRPKIE